MSRVQALIRSYLEIMKIRKQLQREIEQKEKFNKDLELFFKEYVDKAFDSAPSGKRRGFNNNYDPKQALPEKFHKWWCNIRENKEFKVGKKYYYKAQSATSGVSIHRGRLPKNKSGSGSSHIWHIWVDCSAGSKSSGRKKKAKKPKLRRR